MSLEELLRRGTVKRITPDARLSGVSLAKARRDIGASSVLYEIEEFDWSLAISYNAMLGAARALMYLHGYRPSSSDGHQAVIRFLEAASMDEETSKYTAIMDRLRKKRHCLVYEEYDVVTGREARQALIWAEGFLERVEKMLEQGT